MQAAERHIIIDKGADFTIKLTVTEGIGSPKNLSTNATGGAYTPKMYLMKKSSDILTTNTDGTVTRTPNPQPLTYIAENGAEVFIKVPVVIGSLIQDGVDSTNVPLPAGETGKFQVVIDSAITELIDTNLPPFITSTGEEESNKNPFATEYTYFYTIEIVQDGVSAVKEELRILRGKCAVRL